MEVISRSTEDEKEWRGVKNEQTGTENRTLRNTASEGLWIRALDLRVTSSIDIEKA